MKHFLYIIISLFLFNVAAASAAKKSDTDTVSKIEYKKFQSVKNETEEEKSSKKPSEKTHENETISVACQVKINEFEDLRMNKETLGTNFAKSLMPEGLNTFLKDAQSDLWTSRLKTGSSTKTITLQPKLKKLYAYAQSMNLHGVIAFSVDFIVDGKTVETHLYRGFGSTMNAWNAEHEYYQAISYAAHNGLPKVLADAAKLCN